MMGGNPDKKKKKKGVDDCTSGQCAPKTRVKLSMKKFSPTKSRYSVRTTEKEIDETVPKPTGGLHTNVRELSADAGDVNASKYNSNRSFTEAEMAAGRKAEIQMRKQKKALKYTR